MAWTLVPVRHGWLAAFLKSKDRPDCIAAVQKSLDVYVLGLQLEGLEFRGLPSP